MLSQTERIKYLLQQYAQKKITGNEEAELFDFISKDEYEKEVKQLLMQVMRNDKPDNLFKKEEWNSVIHKILQAESETVKMFKPKRISRTIIAAAATLLAAVSLIVIFSLNHGEKKLADKNFNQGENDLLPGSSKAILTLGNGSEIALDSATNGTVTQQGKTIILKQNNSGLVYSSNQLHKESEVFYNTLSTPVGGQYQVVLPDGTKAWLNAASSLRYPTAFTGTERNVELTGEAYFEVAKDKTKPFNIKVNDILVQVLGTHFNINSYSNEEAIKTTLLEGSVKISAADKTAMLAPGQQAVINNSKEINVLSNIDVDQVTAWKDENFYFKNDDITEIAKQLSRWYGADINIKEQISQHYTGIISRQNNISAVLEMLELAGGIHFGINGNNITVTGH